MSDNSSDHRPKPRILFGQEEAIFSALPQNVLDNLRHPASENALVWNLLYPLAQPKISLTSLLELPPLWGTAELPFAEDELVPYFWGYGIEGERLPSLDRVLEQIDGAGPKTEVDLFLLGKRTLILVEAKNMASFGRCSRYAHHRCPEIHVADLETDLPNEENGMHLESEDSRSCRYWEAGKQRFRNHLNFGKRPSDPEVAPPCYRHYQLARTLCVGVALAKRIQKNPVLWLMVSRQQWPSLESAWLDFAEKIRDDVLWRRMRVLAWEDVRGLTKI